MTTADQLPEDELAPAARELMQSGELRLALRAAFLASLAHLGQRELIRARAPQVRPRLRPRAALPRPRADRLAAAFGRNLESFERPARRARSHAGCSSELTENLRPHPRMLKRPLLTIALALVSRRAFWASPGARLFRAALSGRGSVSAALDAACGSAGREGDSRRARDCRAREVRTQFPPLNASPASLSPVYAGVQPQSY